MESIDYLEKRGFTGHFFPADAGLLRCLGCEQSFQPFGLGVCESIRMEGASDPAEMAIVLGARCPLCDALGTLTLSYGPLASDEDAAVMEKL